MTAATADPRPLDRSDPLPLWAQLRADLQRRLDAGEFDARFPTEKELTEAYGVSRQTVREAVRRLAGLDRQRGRGTFVRKAEFEQPLGGLYSLFRAVESRGVEQSSQVRVLELRADAVAASHLQLPADSPLVYLERIRLAGGEPLALDRTWLPAELAGAVLGTDFNHTALYDELALRDVRMVGGQERIRPVVPSRTERGLLGMRAGEAAFAVERLAWTADRLAEFRNTIVRGDRYSFVVDWSSGQGPDVTLTARPLDPPISRNGPPPPP